MKIELDSKQYRDLMITIGIADGVLEMLREGLPEEKNGAYIRQSDRIWALESHLLGYAKDMDCEDMAETHGGELTLSDAVFEQEVTPLLDHYNEYMVYDAMASELAWRDIVREIGAEEAEKLESANDEKSLERIQKYEAKYWDEFDQHDFNRLEIQA